MNHFHYKADQLLCEDVPIEALARKIGTPFYLYSYTALIDRFKEFDRAFHSIPHIICFAVKANGSLAILRALAHEGSGADVVSVGELFRALKAGIPPERIVFAGVGKRADEIEEALKANILMLNVESPGELDLIDEIAGRLKTRAPIALRVNPDIDPKTHPYIATGLRESKFGIDISEALEWYCKAANMPNIFVGGIHMHLGSQIIGLEPFKEGLQRLINLLKSLNKEGIHIRYLDIGGGLGISYKDEKPPTPGEFASAISPLVKDLNLSLKLILEPGRALVGKAGALVTKVLYVKKKLDAFGKSFIIVDAGMNDLIRPSLYNAYHKIQPVCRKNGGHFIVDIVGPVCETADFFAKDREMPQLNPEDLLAIMDTGAYGFSMASNYNARPRPAEVMVKGDKYFIIRERENYKDLIRGEHIPSFLR